MGRKAEEGKGEQDFLQVASSSLSSQYLGWLVHNVYF
jgi:hypothetical protein